jgi:hypothetical protein
MTAGVKRVANKIASLYAEIGADTTKLDAGLKTAKSGLSQTANAFEQLTGVSFGAVAAFTAVGKGLVDVTKAAMDAQKADANLEATLKSTKNAVGLTADEIKRMTANLSDMSGQDDEAIQNAQAMLLTFTKIGKEVFPEASLAMVNMAAKFGSLDAASIQLGKALNDPIAGVTALRRVGVMLTDEQEKSIAKFMEMNDIASAQRVILSELETEFGGLAQAMGNTFEGKINRLNVSFGNLKETIGSALIPVLSDAADGLNLILTYGQKLEGVLQDHSKQVAITAKTYEEYGREMAVSRLIANGVRMDLIDVDAAIQAEDKSLEELIAEWGGFTKAQFDDIKASQAMQKALKDTRAAAEWTAAGFDEFASSLGEASSVTNKDAIPAAQSLTSAYGSLNQQMLFAILSQGMEQEAALQLGIAMGVLSPTIIAARDAAESLNSKYRAGAIDAKSYAGQADALAAAIAKLQDKSITITTYYKNNGERSDNLTDPNLGGPGNGAVPVPNSLIPGAYGTRNLAPDITPKVDKLAGGGSWIVPPGYIENYPLPGGRTASSGEKVTVTPAGNSRIQGEGITINVYGNDSPYQTALKVAEVLRRK